jgi:putative PIN family toxin of toxin-antitoxin system
MRAVVDTNILVSFAIRPNRDFEKLFDFLAAHGVTLVSEETIGELFAVLSREKFRPYISQKSAIDYVEWYTGISEMVTITEQVAACSDPKDDKLLSLAITGKPIASFRATAIYWAWWPSRLSRFIAQRSFSSVSPSRA